MANQRYDKHRAVMAERMRRESREGRDIFPMPPVRNWPRRISTQQSLEAFCKTYFPTLCKKPFGSHHKKAIAKQAEVITCGGRVVIAMPRGTGKTTLSIIAVLWAILYGHMKFVVIVTAKQNDSQRILSQIQKLILLNERLLEDFPEAIYPLRCLAGTAALANGQMYCGKHTSPRWTSDTIVFPTIPGSLSSGSIISTFGIGAAIRGQSVVMPDGSIKRPDLILLDDVQTNKSAQSPKQIDTIEEQIETTIEGLAGPGEIPALIFNGTVIKENDVVDRRLDPRLFTDWEKLRFKMLERFPDRMDLWQNYRGLWAVSPKEATTFYKKNRADMDAGAVVAWEHDFKPGVEVSALEKAMRLWCKNESSFFSERQNEPIRPDMSMVIVPAKVIRTRLNGLTRRVAPSNTVRITAFIDVHADLLYYAVAAWEHDFTGSVIDYGTFPEQSVSHFYKSDTNLRTLKTKYPGMRSEAAILRGLTHLGNYLASCRYPVEGQNGYVGIDRVLIDAGFQPAVVQQAVRAVKSTTLKPSLGRGIKASKKPFYKFARLPGMTIGKYWIEDKPKNWSCKAITIDVNYWKVQLHDAFSLDVGDRGGLSLWGDNPESHRMLSEHCTAEIAALVKSGENEVNEWELIGGRDNHLFDCLVGAMTAASTIGVKTPEDARNIERRRGTKIN